MITVIKKIIIIKEKEGKRQGKKCMWAEYQTWDLSSNIMVLPQSHEGSLALTP